MDPLTHTLVGANLASTRLRDTTRFATAALVVGANLPDVDSILYYLGKDDLALGFRRGWTHGILAIVLLPILQTAFFLLWDRLRPHAERTASTRWLFLLSAGAILTHPFLDWLNNYGLRWLMPFRPMWFYGDSVFIMDPWLWLILGCGWLAPRRATRATIALWGLCAAATAYVVARNALVYLPVVAAVAMVLLVALLWRPRVRWIATAALLLAALYIAMRLTTHAVAEARVVAEVHPEKVMVGPNPFDPTQWDVVVEKDGAYRFGHYSLIRGLELERDSLPVPRPSRQWDLARRDPSIRGFMTWVRFPWYEVERRGDGTHVFIGDARYAPRRGGGRKFGQVEVVLP